MLLWIKHCQIKGCLSPQNNTSIKTANRLPSFHADLFYKLKLQTSKTLHYHYFVPISTHLPICLSAVLITETDEQLIDTAMLFLLVKLHWGWKCHSLGPALCYPWLELWLHLLSEKVYLGKVGGNL